ncbi:PREDICTED: phosphatidylinositol N-acetylglucosaminyltransferase subunit C-like isoform X1 [Priapulus caudatus]|uniref:Phosphatidylinositol N-acetylglucosaminyltransferase subunit C-like isoform X1 n=1 Tax=Priapulus caudatus TaxID=37621 RepID=A0ABM1E996_PRICU|nr:PREDICTED: phosphatidylinositol N-acetylglucosaminyltransferase subunit C-like isoform X1 [Priapulus caudatus]XP_014668766.1 PREDICTED: phosphatidylinositol N-acetylglucosaminyltransferase subunit C-like isoform X1 [Priapulus caudatus]XP_014668767.1 PREDICTED: phosphatidylinositol N-acetylglucosaminyltransferase subunit C-like isoform X1 [Priapulus caudatus]
MPPNQLKWKRVLYEKQDVPDNYVDETFLDELRKNVNTTTYSFWPTVLESGVVTQQLSSVIIFVDSFVLMQEGEVSPHTLFAVSALLTLIAYVIYKSTASAGTVSISEQDGGNEESCIVDDIKAAITFLALAYGLAPILATLTESISTDTIYAMSTAMLLANLVLYDYGPSAAIVSGTVSFNAAMFASVCLASRLPTLWHTFATVTLSAEMFAMLPIFRKRLKGCYGSRVQAMMTLVLGLVALAGLWHISPPCAALFLILHTFITFVCPLWLLQIQPFKDNIHGPWDEAEIRSCDTQIPVHM